MKKVFPNHDMVAHVFAQRTQYEGHAGNIFFEGDCIYSYGRHFCIAEFAKTPKGKTYMLWNTDTYSLSTSHHQSIVARAICQYTAFPMEFSGISTNGKISYNHNEYRKHLIKEGENLFKNLNRRKRGVMSSIESGLMNIKREWNTHQEFFGIKDKAFPVTLPENWKEIARAKKDREEFLAIGADARQIKRREQKEKKAKIAAKAQRLNENTIIKDFIVAFNNGDSRYIPFSLGMRINVMLRIQPSNSEMVETSQRAEFPLSHAKKAFQKIKECRNTKTAWKRNGHGIPCGHFQIDRIAENGNINAGCHKIKWYQIKSFAISQNWLEA